MSVDYNLIIIGNTPAGIQSAVSAALQKARVALVTQYISASTAPELVQHHRLVEMARVVEQLQRSRQLPLWKTGVAPTLAPTSAPISAIDWELVQEWTAAILQNVQTGRSLTMLASLGVDVINASGEFCRKPSPGFLADGRLLQAKAYLLTMGSRPVIPAIEGLQTTGFLTIAACLEKLQYFDASHRMVILGGDWEAISLAQSLVRLGIATTLILPSELVPEADPEVSGLIQAQLEAEGVDVITHTSVTQVREIAGKKWLQVGNQALEVDEIIVATGQLPDGESLNLEAVGAKSRVGIAANQKLQALNPKIYACPGQVGNQCLTHVAQYEAAIALKNALFFPTTSATYQGIPFTLATDPEVAWIGLTEPEARQRYGKKVFVLRRSLTTLPLAQIRNDLTGLCKLIVNRNGKIVGAHLVGNSARELIGIIALAMQQNLPIHALRSLVVPSTSLAELLSQTAADWQRVNLQKNPWQQDLLDSFFDWQRWRSRP